MGQDGSGLIVSGDLVEFFRTEVQQARAALKLAMGEQTEFYLVQLLCDYSMLRPQRDLSGEPLALLYKKALEAQQGAQVAHYKQLADEALVMAGFFTDAIERTLVDVDYYICMGGSAYSNLAKLVGDHHHGAQFAQLYAELAVHFTDHVDVLNQISERARINRHCDTDLLKLYDRYARTGSRRIRRQLLERGLLPSQSVPTDYVQ